MLNYEAPGQESSDAATHANGAVPHQLTNLPAFITVIITVAQDVINGEHHPHTNNPSAHANRRAQRRASQKEAEATPAGVLEARIPDREATKIEAIAAGREQLYARSRNGMPNFFPIVDPETAKPARKVRTAKASGN
ncbi:hypothetical protein DIPPA_33199 [Diplonema papillatum]|nr:hypothetical protein DIPPA_33199 [Diplonema papillatum]